jgi:hypothetical protein
MMPRSVNDLTFTKSAENALGAQAQRQGRASESKRPKYMGLKRVVLKQI